MKEENGPYKTFKQLLDEASLQPKENDWENMQALLDKQLPPTGGQRPTMPWPNWFKGFLLVCVVAVVVCIWVEYTAPVTNINAAGNNDTDTATTGKKITGDNKANPSSLTHNEMQTTLDSIQVFGTKNNLNTADSFASNATQNATNNNKGKSLNNKDSGTLPLFSSADKKAKINSAAATFVNKQNKLKNKPKGKTAAVIVQGDVTKSNDQNHNITDVLKEKNKTHADELTKNTNQQTQHAVDSINKTTVTKTESRQHDTAKTAVTLQQKQVDGNALQDIAVKNDTSNKTANAVVKQAANNNAMPVKKTFISTAFPKPKFEYGFQLSPLQKGLNAGGKPTLNPVPGVYAHHLVSNNLCIGIMLLPYSSTYLKNNNQYFSTSSATVGDSLNPATTTTNTNYFVKNLYTLKTGIYVGYKVAPHFSLEVGAGLVHTLSGKGNTNTTTYRDSLLVFSKTSSYRVYLNDSAFSGIRKNTPFAYVNAWYNNNQWQIGVGLQQNFKGWFKSGGSTPASQVQLNFRYNLNYRK